MNMRVILALASIFQKPLKLMPRHKQKQLLKATEWLDGTILTWAIYMNE